MNNLFNHIKLKFAMKKRNYYNVLIHTQILPSEDACGWEDICGKLIWEFW